MVDRPSKAYPSETYPIGENGGKARVRLSFLKEATAEFKAPEIAALYLHLEAAGTGVGTAAAVTLAGEDQFRLFERIFFKDQGALPRLDIDGTGAYLKLQRDYGDKQVDPATQAANTTNASFELILPIELQNENWERERDCVIAVDEIRRGAEMVITVAPSGWIDDVVHQGFNLTVWAEVVEGRDREAKSRVCWVTDLVEKRDDTYAANGSLAWAVMYAPNGETAAGLASWSDYAEYDVPTLDMTDHKRVIHASMYQRARAAAANDKVLAGECLPIWTPRRSVKIPQMPDLEEFRVILPDDPPALAKMLKCVVTDRVPQATARVLQMPLSAAAKAENLEVVTAKAKPSGKRNIRLYRPRDVARLPVRQPKARATAS